MKLDLNKKLIATLIISCLTACGGGGGDGDDARNISGNWKGALTKLSDNCDVKGPESITVSHQVNQNEDAISLLSEAGYTFLGNAVGQNGFSVDGSHQTVGNSACTDQTRIEYDEIVDDDDPAADIQITINRSCSNTSSCMLQYTGTVSRSVNAIPAPTTVSSATPGITPTPLVIAGGCYDMNPKTEAGGFSGNGGCGISQANYSIQGNLVILEPFGSNGLTSFGIDASNSAVANSQRQDLSILGVDGNQCSITCSPPSTFTVKCLKEGGSSCIEKF